MRRRSCLAIGTLVLLPSIGVSGAAPAGAAPASHRAPETVQQSVGAHRTAESAFITTGSQGGRPAASSIRLLLGDLPTKATLAFAAWVLLGIAAALVSSAGFRPARRGRAPPIRFL